MFDNKMLHHNQFHISEWCLCTEAKCSESCQHNHDFERPGRIWNIHQNLMKQ